MDIDKIWKQRLEIEKFRNIERMAAYQIKLSKIIQQKRVFHENKANI